MAAMALFGPSANLLTILILGEAALAMLGGLGLVWAVPRTDYCTRAVSVCLPGLPSARGAP